EQQRTIAMEDTLSDPLTQDYRDDYLVPNKIWASLDAPVRVAGKLVGVICHEEVAARRAWTPEESSFAASMADLIAIAYENAERRQAQLALAESESKFRGVAETAGVAIYIHDGQSFLYVNRASESISGYSREELMKLNPFTLLHPDFLEPVKQRTLAR